MDQRLMGRVLGLVASGAEVKEVRGMGLIIIKTNAKRSRRTKAEMTRDKKQEHK